MATAKIRIRKNGQKIRLLTTRPDLQDFDCNFFPATHANTGGSQMEFEPDTTDDRAIEQRNLDRRIPSMKTLRDALLLQRRRSSRREGDHLNSYTDWYGHWPLAATTTIILLCFADAFLTIVLLSKGAVELNGLMDYLIQRDVFLFAVVKMSVTGTALIILVLHFNFRVYKYIAVRYLVYAIVPLYSLLIFHELNMLANI
jgi:hypothetical protein